MPDSPTPADTPEDRFQRYLADHEPPPLPDRRQPWPAQVAVSILASVAVAGMLLMSQQFARRVGLWP